MISIFSLFFLKEKNFNYFKNKYDITSDNVEDIRKILAIRYEISYKGYSSTKSIEIASNIFISYSYFSNLFIVI